VPKFRSSGGFWVVMIPPANATGVIAHNAETEVVTEVEIAESLSGSCGGWTEALTKFKRVEQARMRVAEDDVFFPQALGFGVGQYVTFYLRRGGLVPMQFDLLVAAVVQTVRRMKDEKKALWVEITCKYGSYFQNVPAPALDPSSQPPPANLIFPPVTVAPAGSVLPAPPPDPAPGPLPPAP
jgi:hypothetical protein